MIKSEILLCFFLKFRLRPQARIELENPYLSPEYVK